MKEAPSSPYNKLLHRFTFNDLATVRRGGGEVTAVTFANGKGTFNGTSSKINYNLGLNGTYSVRIRCNPTSFAALRALLDMRGSNNDGTGIIYLNATNGRLTATSGTKYVNGVAGTTVIAGVNNELVITGISLIQGTGANLSLIGSNYVNSEEFLGTIDLVEIYQGTLTASEVANLYNNTWNTEQSFGGEPKSSILQPLNFIEDWTAISNTVINDSDTYTTTSSGGVRTNGNNLEISKDYLITIEGNTTSDNVFLTGVASEPVYINDLNGSFSSTFKTNPIISGKEVLYIRNGSAGVTNISKLTIQEINPKTLLDFDNTNGVLDLGDYTDTATATDITVNKNGALFNGTSSKIDTGTDMIGNKAVTLLSWFYNKWGVSDNKFVRLIDNKKFLIQLQISDQIIVRGDGSTALLGTNGLIKKDKWIFMAVTRAIDGTTFIYMGDKNTAPYQDKTGNTGTPVVGTNNIIIGSDGSANNIIIGSDGSANKWFGYVNKLTVYEGILSLQDITREWSSSRREI